MSRVFLTGATGYIGGQVLSSLRRVYPELQTTALVRKEEQAKLISQSFPNVKAEIGDLENDDLIQRLAGNADIIIHAAHAKHIQSVQAIARGIEKKQNPVHWIQVSGASLVAFPEIEAKIYGEPSDQVYGDVEQLSEIKQLISKYSSARLVDNFILNLNNSQVKTALIFPPIIYGAGQGPVNQRSIQIPELSRVALQNGQAVHVGTGAHRWSNVHIVDLGYLVVKLVEKALEEDGNNGLWNENGIYFPENETVKTFGEISQMIAVEAIARGWIQNHQVKSVTHTEVDQMIGHGSVILGTNAALNGQRARKYLNWKPQEESLEANIPSTVELEAKALSM